MNRVEQFVYAWVSAALEESSFPGSAAELDRLIERFRADAAASGISEHDLDAAVADLHDVLTARPGERAAIPAAARPKRTPVRGRRARTAIVVGLALLAGGVVGARAYYSGQPATEPAGAATPVAAAALGSSPSEEDARDVQPGPSDPEDADIIDLDRFI